jgi:hypothetical protein
MTKPETTLESVLREYHEIAVRVGGRAKLVKARTEHTAEITKLARTDYEEAQRQKRRHDNSVVVHDFGDACVDLRHLMKKSAKLLRIK